MEARIYNKSTLSACTIVLQENAGYKRERSNNAIFKMDNLEGHTGNSAELCGSLDGKGVWGRMDTCICMAKPLNVHMKLS